MKNYIFKRTLVCLAALLLATGCEDDFLESEIPGRLPEDQFYQTDEDAIQATAAVYDMLQAHYNWGWASMYLVKTLPSDESNAGGSGPGDQPGYQTLDDFTFDSQNDAILGAWSMSYYGIYRANKVINHVAPETDLRRRLLAEAKALRALYYLDLVSLWGGVPLVLNDVPPSEYTAQQRASREEVYAQIEQDLTEAIPDLPLKSSYGSGERFRFTKGAAQALLGRAYLYQEEWQQAAEQLDEVINSGQYSLEPDFSRVFSLEGEFGPESLFEVAYSSDADYDWGNFPWGNGRNLESNIHIQLMGPRSDFYTKAPEDSLIGGWGFNTPRPTLYQSFVNAADTERRIHTIMSEQELEAKGGSWSAPTAYDYMGYFQRKYGSFSNQTNSQGGAIGELNYGTNWRLIRYADVLLMAAEAYYRLGNEGRARQELNKVRERADLDEITASGTDLFNAIVRERELELAFEGFRYIDLVRWGLAAEVLGPLGYVEGKHNLLPIPDADVRTANLTQNPGY
ncbi:RagB/SusD family nutrient uptake outer membrane protein [Pontibacter korlensis]|uniref:Membrane protein n=1 Tax=Pontibacter korlensis TaxID=400092 RepID=A0A0E3ZD02_9BACT|nr:RagB/SusD family nutrient uptake outer membrane protein [Pontibacter korlensis]AKD01974.1 membrane protein [Pontibacter korlensis]